MQTLPPSKPAPRALTANSPLKEVLASCEVTPAWPGVVQKLAEGRGDERPLTFLKQMAKERVLKKKKTVAE